MPYEKIPNKINGARHFAGEWLYQYDKIRISQFTIREEKENVVKPAPWVMNFFRLYCVAEGEIRLCADGVECVMLPGDFLFLDRNSVVQSQGAAQLPTHTITVDFVAGALSNGQADCDSRTDLLNGYLFTDRLSRPIRIPPGYVFHDENGEALWYITQLDREYHERGVGYQRAIKNLLEQLLLLIYRDLQKLQAEQVACPDIVQYMIDYVQANCTSPITLTDLSRQMNYSVSYLSLRFKEYMGISFVKYLLQVRIYRASCLLHTHPNKTVAEIARMVGIADTEYFRNKFRTIVGMTPTEYRKYTARLQTW